MTFSDVSGGATLVLAAVLLLSCGGDNGTPTADMGLQDSDYPIVSYSERVAPIIRSNCAVDGCHAEDGKKNFAVRQGQAATDEEIFAALRREASTGMPLIDPGRPTNSEVVRRIEEETAFMPPLQRLPIDQRNDLRFWVAQGAQRDEN